MLAKSDQVAFSASAPVKTVIPALLNQCARSFHFHLTELMEADDPDGPHKARIALRRFRTLLTAFRRHIDPDLADKLARRARTYFRAIGAIRDADVLASQATGHPLLRTDSPEPQRQRKRIRKQLDRDHAHRLRDIVDEAFADKSWRRSGARHRALLKRPIADVAAAALDEAWGYVLAHGSDLNAMSPRERHDLRKDLKTLRYLTEAFVPCWPGADPDAPLSLIRQLQDMLGTLNDMEVARARGVAQQDDDRAATSLSQAETLLSDLRATPLWWAGGTRPAPAEP